MIMGNEYKLSLSAQEIEEKLKVAPYYLGIPVSGTYTLYSTGAGGGHGFLSYSKDPDNGYFVSSGSSYSSNMVSYFKSGALVSGTFNYKSLSGSSEKARSITLTDVEVKEKEGTCYIGNVSIMTGKDYDNTREPYLIYHEDGYLKIILASNINTENLVACSNQTINLSADYTEEEVFQLDKKFIPDYISKTEFLEFRKYVLEALEELQGGAN